MINQPTLPLRFHALQTSEINTLFLSPPQSDTWRAGDGREPFHLLDGSIFQQQNPRLKG